MQRSWVQQFVLTAVAAFAVAFGVGFAADSDTVVTRVGAKIIRLGNDNGSTASSSLSASDCHPSYSGGCVPANAWDVDCAGGGGNGPEFVRGPVRVVGPDVYRLDGDGDGRACEPFNR